MLDEDNYTTLLDEDILDEDILDEEYDFKIKDKEEELASLSDPKTITTGFENMDPKIREEVAEAMKKMPRDKLLNLIASLGENHSNLGNDFNFQNMSENSKKTAKEKLSDKLNLMKYKRRTKYSLTKENDKYEKAKQFMDDYNDKLVQIKENPVSNIIDLSESLKSNQLAEEKTAKLSKYQKKKLKNKNKKMIQVVESTDQTDQSDQSDQSVAKSDESN